jgi:hypothetical protein
MRNPEVPDDGLESLAVRRDIARVDRGNDDAGVGGRGGIAAVLAEDPDDPGADLFR